MAAEVRMKRKLKKALTALRGLFTWPAFWAFWMPDAFDGFGAEKRRSTK